MSVDDAATASSVNERWQGLASALARAVRRQCPAWLAADADDIAQQALAKVMRSGKVGEGKPPLASFYLNRVAHSALVDEIRRRRRRREVALEESGDSEQGAPAVEAVACDPEQTAALRELGGSIRACLKEMKRERRLAVALYLQGHSVAEASRVLGWAIKRTENLVYRGLADLRQCLMTRGHTS